MSNTEEGVQLFQDVVLELENRFRKLFAREYVGGGIELSEESMQFVNSFIALFSHDAAMYMLESILDEELGE